MIVFRNTFDCNPNTVSGNATLSLTFEARSHRGTDISITYLFPDAADSTTWSNGLKTISFNGIAERFFMNYGNDIEVIILNRIPPRSIAIDVIVKDLTDGTLNTRRTTLNIF